MGSAGRAAIDSLMQLRVVAAAPSWWLETSLERATGLGRLGAKGPGRAEVASPHS